MLTKSTKRIKKMISITLDEESMKQLTELTEIDKRDRCNLIAYLIGEYYKIKKTPN